MATKIANEEFPVENLYANNFLSLHKFKYEHKGEQFCVITGDMASGKSLIIKLLEFFNNIYVPLMSMDYKEIIENLKFDNFSEKVIIDFMIRFNLKENMVFDLEYSCSYKKIIFSVKLFRNSPKGKIELKSEFLDNQLKEWRDYLEYYFKSKTKSKSFGKFISPLELYRLENDLNKMLSLKFNNLYPFATIFIPATRASLATKLPLNKRNEDTIDKLNSNFRDYYLNSYERLIESIKFLPETKYRDKINDILKATIKINGDIHLTSKDGRDVDIYNAASGQQESFYILLLLEKLPILKKGYYRNCNIYIEEPEAHLFPYGQRRILELIVEIFNDINSKCSETKCSPIKFYITTHSPYVLNAINNMLMKGNLLKKFPNSAKKILNDKKTKNIPPLDYEKISAIFINNKGKFNNILKEYNGNRLINPDDINNISRRIEDYFSILNELDSELKKNNKNA